MVGLVLFVGGTWLLYWNEGRSVATAEAIGEAQRATVEMPDVTKIDPQFEGKMIHATGPADTQDTLRDAFSGLNTTAISLKRQVEFYQWVEQSKSETRKKVGGGSETITTYTYRQAWRNSPEDSSVFKDRDYANKNTVLTTAVQSETMYAKNVSFGAYMLPQFVIERISGAVPSELSLTEDDVADLNGRLFPDADEQSYVHIENNNVIYLGLSPSSPQIGDMRVTYTEVKPTTISILAQVTGNTFEQFRASNNNTFSKVSMGTVGADNMFGEAYASNTMMTWGIRGGGILLIIISLALFMSPLSVLASIIPLFGSIVGAGTFFVAFLIGLAWSLLIIAIAWLRFRPLLGGGLLAGVIVLLLLFHFRRRRKMAQMA